MLLFISGSYPNAQDGIGSCAKILLDTMASKTQPEKYVLLTTDLPEIRECIEAEKSIKTEYLKDWKVRIKNIRQIYNILEKYQVDQIHMEYPGACYGKTFLATFLPLLLKFNPKFRHIRLNVRLHEFTKARLLRKLAIMPIALFADSLYIPALHDREVMERLVGKKVKETIIGTNISVYPVDKIEKDKIIISYFGYIYPGKGIKEMIELWKEIHNRDISNKIRFKIIGELNPEGKHQFAEYHKQTCQWLKEAGLEDFVDITGYVSDEEASKEMQLSDIATVLYDDGLTLRRGSFIAFLTHGVPIITSEGDRESATLFKNANGVMMMKNQDEAVEKVYQWIKMDKKELSTISEENKKMAEYFSWDSIADKFIQDYNLGGE